MNSSQQTFRHLVDASNFLAGPPPLHPAPSSIPPASSCSSGPTHSSSSSSVPTPASSSSSGPLEFITSERGKPKLIHDGYHYLLPWPSFLLLTAISIPAFESLSTQFLQDELPLLAYFEKTWIGTPVGATRRLTPDFPIQVWNALEMSAAGSTRTTNALEAYHHAFNALISCQHPSVWKFLDSAECTVVIKQAGKIIHTILNLWETPGI